MMNSKKLTSCFFALSLGLFAQTASADFIGIKVGGGIWDHDVSGTVRYIDLVNVDLKNDLKLADEQDTFVYAVFEHPVPLIPNVKVSKSGLSTSGSGVVSTPFSYGGTTYNVSESISSKLVLDHQDVTAYFQILDNIVSLDIGITAKMLDGYVSITRSGVTSRNVISGTIPMIYGAVGVTIPLSGIYVGVEGSSLNIGDNEISDITAKVVYKSALPFGIEGGIRDVSIKLDGLDAVTASMTFSGPFINLFLHF
ncbi:MAG: TIGR04219 family outer membrane beta-barrel protein [Gammaproteobacteria bacterium]|nr:TIGR04219 family outer membrane beta-barrel protein [Gammaproteobacteria bacterium]MDH5652645.1 TIGR04219 family outer membrane beta-barrel protein [Gammaproteobacteria bacterium]